MMIRSTALFLFTTGWQSDVNYLLSFYFNPSLLFSVGGMISLSGCMAGGITMVIRWDISSALRLHHTIFRDKFSASNYWKDCVKYKVCRFFKHKFWTETKISSSKVTAAQYIGEICRYLINSQPCPEENTHGVRLMFGNGLRPDIWTQFVSRWCLLKFLRTCHLPWHLCLGLTSRISRNSTDPRRGTATSSTLTTPSEPSASCPFSSPRFFLWGQSRC